MNAYDRNPAAPNGRTVSGAAIHAALDAHTCPPAPIDTRSEDDGREATYVYFSAEVTATRGRSHRIEVGVDVTIDADGRPVRAPFFYAPGVDSAVHDPAEFAALVAEAARVYAALAAR